MSPPVSENLFDKNVDVKAPPQKLDIPLKSMNLGVWNVTLAVEPFSFQRNLKDLYHCIPTLRRLGYEIYTLCPHLFILFVAAKIWAGIEDALLMYLSNLILKTVEIGLITGKPDILGILLAVAARMICMAIVASLDWWSERTLDVLKGRVSWHFGMQLLSTRVRMDLPTELEYRGHSDVNVLEAWFDVVRIVEYLTTALMPLSQLVLLCYSSNFVGGRIFALLCVTKPLVQIFTDKRLWNQAFVANEVNPDYLRMFSFERFATDRYRQDILNANLGDFIINEYTKAYERLGSISSLHIWHLYRMRATPNRRIALSILQELPTLYWVLNAIQHPDKYSLASIAILQQSSSQLRNSFTDLLWGANQFRKDVNNIQTIYDASEVKNKIQDGHIAYPPAYEKENAGMRIELRDVSFAYPGSSKLTNALCKISLSIKPGQLVVIVGANGSGKSTIIKLLSRLFEPTSGEILIDGIPQNMYRVSDLRQSTAILSQDNVLYPLSLGENIGLGFPEKFSDNEEVEKACQLGGASEFVNKLGEGLSTMLEPAAQVLQRNFKDIPGHPLHEVLKKLEKKVDISGGEKQRVIAARTFMRLSSGKIKFVAVDEPSSALDAEGELKLFKNLIEARAGKTMIFVTHRFGHLTRHADQIICMKDGTVAEFGSHDELMNIGGEYAKMYGIQAKAFS